jgi:hypothetical protein
MKWLSAAEAALEGSGGWRLHADHTVQMVSKSFLEWGQGWAVLDDSQGLS